MKAIFWLLGLLATAGGGVYIFSRTTGRNILKSNACIDDIEFKTRDEIKEAYKIRDIESLRELSKHLEEKGWRCAAGEVDGLIDKIQGKILAEKQLEKCPTRDQIEESLKDIVSKKLSRDKANLLAAKLRKNGCTADADIIDQKVSVVYGVEYTKKETILADTKLKSPLSAIKAQEAAENADPNYIRARNDWPGIMSITELDWKSKLHIIGLGLKKDGAEFIVKPDSSSDSSTASGSASYDSPTYTAVHLIPANSTYALYPPEPTTLRFYMSQLKDIFGDKYNDAIRELGIIEYSIRRGDFKPLSLSA